ncbi:MAG: hypothetical protein ACERKN_04680 [Velocimicrobium sp.]
MMLDVVLFFAFAPLTFTGAVTEGVAEGRFTVIGAEGFVVGIGVEVGVGLGVGSGVYIGGFTTSSAVSALLYIANELIVPL